MEYTDAYFCQRCGAEATVAGSRFCRICGGVLAEPQRRIGEALELRGNESRSPALPWHKGRKGALIVFGLLCLGAAIEARMPDVPAPAPESAAVVDQRRVAPTAPTDSAAATPRAAPHHRISHRMCQGGAKVIFEAAKDRDRGVSENDELNTVLGQQLPLPAYLFGKQVIELAYSHPSASPAEMRDLWLHGGPGFEGCDKGWKAVE